MRISAFFKCGQGMYVTSGGQKLSMTAVTAIPLALGTLNTVPLRRERENETFISCFGIGVVAVSGDVPRHALPRLYFYKAPHARDRFHFSAANTAATAVLERSCRELSKTSIII